MEELRSNVWSAETLVRGVEHATLQPEFFASLESMSDQELMCQLQDCQQVLHTVYSLDGDAISSL